MTNDLVHLRTPWSLHFDRDGTEDMAVIRDADGDELFRSRHFWRPEDDDPIPATLAAARLAFATPALLTALGDLLARIEGAYGDIDVRGAVSAISEATGDGSFRESDEPDIEALLADRKQIALIWGIDDVREIRPDLSDEHAWEVLQIARAGHDANIGLCWETLEWIASDLFGNAPANDDAKEA